jgi:4-amino-4-deoxy-L-arabinose transferase-like glycosyltransferase
LKLSLSSDSSDSNYSKDRGIIRKLEFERYLRSPVLIDFIFGIFCLSTILYYSFFISDIKAPIWDGAEFMINAREWLDNTTAEKFASPLFSWIIAAIWIFTGENWTTIKYVQMAFTIASVVLLYVILRRRKGALFALGVSALTLTNAQLFYYTSQILTEGISLFFLILTLYFFEGTKRVHWVLSGISTGLTFAARYPILLQSMTIFVVESILRKDIKSSIKATIAIIAVILLVVGIVYAKTGTFEMALEDSNFGTLLSSYYIVNAIPIWGPAILLLPVAFLFKSTYRDKFNFIFIAWFIISLLSWSTNASNQQYRFMIQFMPAAYFLVILAIENVIKFDKNNLIFQKFMNLSSRTKIH